MKRIDNKLELVELAIKLGVRNDWHEPDEQDVTADMRGGDFDNAGFWGSSHMDLHEDLPGTPEMWVTLYQSKKPVAEINLATLFAFACGTYDGENIPPVQSPADVWERLWHALAVLIGTPHIRAYLQKRDCMALRQAEFAMLAAFPKETVEYLRKLRHAQRIRD